MHHQSYTLHQLTNTITNQLLIIDHSADYDHIEKEDHRDEEERREELLDSAEEYRLRHEAD